MKEIIRHMAGYLLGFTLFFLLIPWGLYRLTTFDPHFPWQLPAYPEVIRWIVSLVLLVTGVLFAAWSNIFLFIKGKGGPTDAFGLAVSPQTKRLVTSGPYRYCRNPMVFGALSVYASIVVFFHSVTALAVWLLFVLLVLLMLKFSEEKRLARDFGEAYLVYKKKVPMIVPLGFWKNRCKPSRPAEIDNQGSGHSGGRE
ncbi:MAG TPA: isoprenylcysteine carboxylmethyltransferase family protein [Bacteroidales bacterium]|nr:isoprenylcysteine carboxylmethyltransferase family protein [Bacteroidales bacterium]HSA44317.1 isoprenylcysteine carboxylmethyltransferase family protein [Bacteroidales bacterium]